MKKAETPLPKNVSSIESARNARRRRGLAGTTLTISDIESALYKVGLDPAALAPYQKLRIWEKVKEKMND
jgi:hypothetical protein